MPKPSLCVTYYPYEVSFVAINNLSFDISSFAVISCFVARALNFLY